MFNPVIDATDYKGKADLFKAHSKNTLVIIMIIVIFVVTFICIYRRSSGKYYNNERI